MGRLQGSCLDADRLEVCTSFEQSFVFNCSRSRGIGRGELARCSQGFEIGPTSGDFGFQRGYL